MGLGRATSAFFFGGREPELTQAQILPDEGHERLHRDLEAACLKSLAPLLNGLVVHLADGDSPTKHPETDRRRMHLTAFAL